MLPKPRYDPMPVEAITVDISNIADANKLMAPTYAVVIIMVFVGLLAGYSDIVRPIQL